MTFSLPANSTISLTSGEIAITHTMTIDGSGATGVKVEANSLGRVFNISASGTVTLTGLVLQHGHATSGGAVLDSAGPLVLKSVSVLSSTATSGNGGGALSGGAATLTNGLFQGNTCSAANCAGGGLSAQNSASVASSTFLGNQAGRGGGVGISGTAALTLTNVTLSGNSALTAGGGLYAGGSSRATLLNVTVADNTAPSGAGLQAELTATVGVTNTLLANNSAANCSGHIDLGSHNLEWPAAACSAAGPAAGFTTADPLLAPLALNAPGTTPTYALPIGSPARDAGDPATCAGPLVNNLDQRGAARPFDGDGVAGAVCDIGAFEATSFVGVTSLTATVRAGGVVSISWQTTSEVGLAGFDVFRSASPSGPWAKVNGALIPAVGAPHAYSIADAPGAGTWYYRLETVDTYALRNSHGPVSVTIYRLLLPLVRR